MPQAAQLANRKQEKNAAAEPRRILFVCTGNTCRSPMAAALLNHMVRPREVCSAAGACDGSSLPIRATSAGLFANAGDPITPAAADALREAGVVPTPDNDYNAHCARPVSEALMEEADEVVAISGAHAMQLLMRFPEHAAKIVTLSMDIPDPFGGTPATYRECLSMLSMAITLRWFCGGEEA